MSTSYTVQHLAAAAMNVTREVIIRRLGASEITVQADYSAAATAQGAWKMEATPKFEPADPGASKWSDVTSDFTYPTDAGPGDWLIVYGGGAVPIPGDALRLTWTPQGGGTSQVTDLLSVNVTRVVP